jgi:phosphoribosyl 1,2-cyclic phosphodiesterase
MRIHVLGSGSRGNAIVLESDRERVLIDAGFGTRTLARRMRSVGVDPASISALFITHEHADHVGGAAQAARKWNWAVYATAGTINSWPRLRRVHAEASAARREVVLDDFAIRFIRTPHDASEPVALTATAHSSGICVGIVYDLGHVTGRFASHFTHLDALLLESNHDDVMLRNGPYPLVVQDRIAGLWGHLSNADAAEMARACIHKGLRHLVLCHLSQKNNRPDVAIGTMRSGIRGAGFQGSLQAASQDTPITVTLARSRRTTQLSLGI